MLPSRSAIPYVELSIEELRSYGDEDTALMYEWFRGVGYGVDVEALRRDYPEVGWHRFEQWARGQDWRVLAEDAA